MKQLGVTKADVARDLDVYTEEIESLIFGLSGMMPIQGGGKGPADDTDAQVRRGRFRAV
jgi:hypothetical protein